MAEELRDLGGLEDEALHVVQRICTQGLHDLRDVEEDEVDWVLLEHSHTILQYQRLFVERRQEVPQCLYGRNWCPMDQVLEMRSGSIADLLAQEEVESLWNTSRPTRIQVHEPLYFGAYGWSLETIGHQYGKTRAVRPCCANVLRPERLQSLHQSLCMWL